MSYEIADENLSWKLECKTLIETTFKCKFDLVKHELSIIFHNFPKN